jgi:hypothetical protein
MVEYVAIGTTVKIRGFDSEQDAYLFIEKHFICSDCKSQRDRFASGTQKEDDDEYPACFEIWIVEPASEWQDILTECKYWSDYEREYQ